MTYLSRPDRRAETEPAEERTIRAEERAFERELAEVGLRRVYTCPWCGQRVRSHSPGALSGCEAALKADMNRRLAGPVRIGDVAGRRP